MKQERRLTWDDIVPGDVLVKEMHDDNDPWRTVFIVSVDANKRGRIMTMNTTGDMSDTWSRGGDRIDRTWSVIREGVIRP